MAFASYTENITERLNEAQRNFSEEISSLRSRLAASDLEEREAIGREIAAVKNRLTKFLDELEKRSKKLIDEAIARVGDHRIDVYRHLEKKDRQAADARRERDQAEAQLSGARDGNARLRNERDQAIRRTKELVELVNQQAVEIRKLKGKKQDAEDWRSAISGVRKRS